jgi:inositol hexakisphosphate/diphosphoinositol-pentakisphosphate kinase
MSTLRAVWLLMPRPPDKAAEILAALCVRVSSSPDRPFSPAEPVTKEPSTWLLKANVTVFRHADRTPKQKLKFNFPIGEPWMSPFVALLSGEKEEVILREKDQLGLIATAIEEAKRLGAKGEDLTKLVQLNNALFSKIDLPGTKAQLKPVYSKRQVGHVRHLSKLTLVFKWGGEVLLLLLFPQLLAYKVIRVHARCKVSISRSRRKLEERHIHHE